MEKNIHICYYTVGLMLMKRRLVVKKCILLFASTLYFGIAGWLLFSNHAYAYIDPSAVTYVIQAVAAVVIALGALVTVFRHKIAAFFKKGSKSEKREIHIVEDESSDDSETV